MLHVVFIQPSLSEVHSARLAPMAEKRADGGEGFLVPPDETSRANIPLHFDDSSHPPAKRHVGVANICPAPPHPDDTAHRKLRSIQFLHGLSLGDCAW